MKFARSMWDSCALKEAEFEGAAQQRKSLLQATVGRKSGAGVWEIDRPQTLKRVASLRFALVVLLGCSMDDGAMAGAPVVTGERRRPSHALPVLRWHPAIVDVQ